MLPTAWVALLDSSQGLSTHKWWCFIVLYNIHGFLPIPCAYHWIVFAEIMILFMKILSIINVRYLYTWNDTAIPCNSRSKRIVWNSLDFTFSCPLCIGLLSPDLLSVLMHKDGILRVGSGLGSWWMNQGSGRVRVLINTNPANDILHQTNVVRTFF